jgi:lipoprotein-anchoring transpeptidase ErfK/SrfK
MHRFRKYLPLLAVAIIISGILIGCDTPDPPNVNPGEGTLTKAERLKEFTRRVLIAPNSSNAEDALVLVSETLTKVEDDYSGVPAEANPGLKYVGRMYAPQEDNIDRNPTGHPPGTIVATTAGNVLIFGPNGSIEVRDKDGKPIWTKPGAN